MHILDNVRIWNFFRWLLDVFFGLYKETARDIREFGIDRTKSILDIGCGSGHHSTVTDADYLGIDMNPAYIEHARR